MSTSRVVLYGSGEGRTIPVSVDGKIATVPLPRPELQVNVPIGDQRAELLYVGAAPGLVSGVFMLFIKYITDKYGANSSGFASPVTIPKGASFKDMIALQGHSDIGNKINTQILQPLVDANERLSRNDFPDFNGPNKLGEGQESLRRLAEGHNDAPHCVWHGRPPQSAD